MSEEPTVDREEIERWFIKRGLPHFIDGYSAGTDIWTRSLPVLGIAYLAGGFNALNLANWSLRRNIAAAVVTVAVLIAGVALANDLPLYTRKADDLRLLDSLVEIVPI